MFDIGWSELMVLGVIALIVVGPKELPVLLRTIGRYAGMMKKQAAEFRSHFDQAMREAELDQFKKDISGFKDEMEGAVRGAANAADQQVRSAERAMREPEGIGAGKAREPEPDPDFHDENGLPPEPAAQPAASKPAEPVQPAPDAVKSGAAPS